MLYVLAFNLLGPVPQAKSSTKPPQLGTFERPFGDLPWEVIFLAFLATIENRLPVSIRTSLGLATSPCRHVFPLLRDRK